MNIASGKRAAAGLAFATSVCVVGGVWVGCASTPTDYQKASSGQGSSRSASVGTDVTVDEIREGAMAAVARSSVGIQGDPVPLASAVAGAIRGYMGETTGPWLAYLTEHGIKPPDVMVNEPDFAAEVWGYWHRVASSAVFDPAAITIRRHASGEAPSVVGYATNTATRPGSRPGIESIPEASRSTIEVVIPGSFQDLQGREFCASLGLEFAMSPTGDWVLMRASMYDVPNGTLVPGPPV